MKYVRVTPVYLDNRRRPGFLRWRGVRSVTPRLGSLAGFLQGPAIQLKPDGSVVVENEWCPQLNKITSETCVVGYQPNEIRISKTEAGHLTPDVVLVPAGLPGPNVKIICQYLIIRDFGVNWRHLKNATINEQFFKDMLAKFEADKSLVFRILGYSDCVGFERHNTFLRKGRARNVFNLMGTSARSRVISVGGAPPKTYLTDNSTIAARADNRSVVIEFSVNTSATI
ncbi:MAG TPA: hypothetical protein VFF31_28610 [Blastocatellia bacterium]|nr:hypothetical protein [Blastocatellia bacterium]